MSVLNWAKTHKFVLLLTALVLFLVYQVYAPKYKLDSSKPGVGVVVEPGRGSTFESVAPDQSLIYPPETNFPVSDRADRIVVQNSNLSLVVNEVRSVRDQIITYAKQSGGFMVESSYNRPEETPLATVTIRVPTPKLDGTLSHIRSLGVKVTSENLVGTDVTDQYVDIEAQLLTLEKTKAKFEELRDKAVTIEDTLNVQRELTNLQQQIDSYKGQKQSLEKNAQLTRITIYLATDELALPYTPDQAFRPNLVFKQAVRGLLTTAQDVAEIGIWLAVYAVVWLPIVLVIIWLALRSRKNPIKSQ